MTTPSSALLVGSSWPATSQFPVLCASSNVTEGVATNLRDTSKRLGRRCYQERTRLMLMRIRAE
jgi:hypothetical protein